MSLQPTVVVIADDAEFPRQVAARWQAERRMPNFTVLRSDICARGTGDAFELAIVGPVRTELLARILGTLTPAPPVILIADDATAAQRVRSEFPRVLVLRQHEGWLDTLMLLAGELLRRVEAQGRAARAEAEQAAMKRNALLGQFVLEMRHNLNNALTSVLGNSELLLLAPGAMGATERAQVATIRNMGVRMHEILQRFSSLEKELTIAETQPDSEWQGQMKATAS
jgi:signal transduction histidine kinase